MTNVTLADSGHDLTGMTPPPEPPAPLEEVSEAPRRSPAEQARFIVHHAEVASLATISDDGSPWASLVGFGVLDGGAPVLMLSTLAEHGRNALREARASMVFALPETGGDHLARGRVTLSGSLVRPEGEKAETAKAAYIERSPAAKMYSQMGDFSTYVLEVERIRWVGGYGVMDWASVEAYAAAEVDPVADAAVAVTHLNEDHADALLEIARAMTGYTDAESARCTGADRYGLDLRISTPRGTAPARAGWPGRLDGPEELRPASIELLRIARERLAAR